jgi:hypothetical protein
MLRQSVVIHKETDNWLVLQGAEGKKKKNKNLITEVFCVERK